MGTGVSTSPLTITSLDCDRISDSEHYNTLNTLHIMSDRTWSSVIFNAVIVAGFIVMVMTVMHSKNLNKALSDEIQQATADFQVFRDKSEVCFKQLDAKNNEINTKNTEVTNAKAAETKLTEEKAQLQKQIEQLNVQLQEAATKVKTLEAAATEAKKTAEASKPAAEAKTEEKKEVTEEVKKDNTTTAA